ncbi:MAG TPA: cysteine peptidase family C39 domain-containing protein [Polyangia bacterium]|jgi:ABC-type bacteriocin/lantibiotic exporter with double-glycine peptidase domain|nr:cysteine peptidase family C39 domain-containing protein [Polyangia bacterium]
MVVGSLVMVAAAGCYQGTARSVSLVAIAHQPGWQLVDHVSMVQQDGMHDCGPAALAMVLERWGYPNAAPAIRQAVGPAKPDGVAAGKLRDFARGKGLQAFLISGVDGDLEREIASDRPVLVGLVQRYSGNRAYAHYEVVVGFNRQRRRVLLLDPGRGPREDDLGAFEREWMGAARLALVVAPA